MTVDYEVTLPDVVAFNTFHARHSPAVQRQLFITRIVVSVLTTILSLVGIYFLPRGGEPLAMSAYIIALVAGGTIYLLYPRLALSSIRKNTAKMLREGRNQGMIGKQQLNLTEEGLRCTSESGTATMHWSSIEKIIAGEDRAYIYVTAVSALIVPARAFTEQVAFETFVQTAQQYQRSHANKQSV